MTNQNAGGVDRRDLLRSAVVVGAATAVGGAAAAPASAGPASAAARQSQRLALVNGRIHTMDPRNRVVSAVVMEDGVFTDVGHGVRTDGARVVNLRGRTV